jgi:hypothetical protein
VYAALRTQVLLSFHLLVLHSAESALNAFEGGCHSRTQVGQSGIGLACAFEKTAQLATMGGCPSQSEFDGVG